MLAIVNERWIALPFLLLFLLGFLYVGLASFGPRLDRLLLRGAQGAVVALVLVAAWSIPGLPW